MSIRAEDIAAKWEEMAAVIETLQSSELDLFDVRPDSRLAADDAQRGGYPVSHAVRWCAAAAIDHLHAVKMLVVDSGVHHLYASSTLARSAIETAATGLWILWPEEQVTRAERCIRWWCQNALDSNKVDPNQSRCDEVRASLTNGVPNANQIRKGYVVTPALEWVNEHVAAVDGVSTAWRLASGFAHGRPWAVLGAQHRETVLGPETDAGIYKMTARDETVLWPALVATETTLALIRRYRTLAGTLDAEPSV